MRRLLCLLVALSLESSSCTYHAGQPMRVIGAGLGRTGTDSMRLALNTLGYHTYHMKQLAAEGHGSHWAGLNQTSSADDLIDLLASSQYNATLDFPACMLYREFMTRYPKAKVLLTVRDTPKKWATSFIGTLGRFLPLVHQRPLSWIPGMREIHDFSFRGAGLQWDDAFKFSQDQAETSYTEWNEAVRAHVPHDRLLVHNSKDGWAPLCAFLGFDDSSSGKMCPREPFPYVNDGATMSVMITGLEMLTAFFPAIAISSPLIVIYLLWHCLGTRMPALKAKGS